MVKGKGTVLTVSGGLIHELIVKDEGSVSLNGGIIGEMVVYDNCQAIVSGGKTETLSGYGENTITIKDRARIGKLHSYGATKVIMDSNDAIIDRLTSRKTCEKCGADYNPNVRPEPADKICVVCGGNIISRQDDNVATIQNRLKVYKEKTEPVKSFYLQKGQFFEVDGNKSVDKVYNDILQLVKKTE